MNYDQYTGIIRAVVPVIITFVVAKGWIPAGSADSVVAAVAAIAAAIWSVLNNRTGKTIQ